MHLPAGRRRATLEGMSDERRRATRHTRKDFPLARLDGGKAFGPTLAYVVDASLTGMRVEVGQRVTRGQSIRFQLDLPAGRISGTAEVRWAAPYGAGYSCGLRFQRLRWWQRGRLLSFLEPAARGAARRLSALVPFLS